MGAVVWADGGWDHVRGLGYSAVFMEGSTSPVVMPLFSSSVGSAEAEALALVLALTLTPDTDGAEIRMDSRTIVDLVTGKTSCTVLELIPYVRWARRMLKSRSLVWIPRDQNLAHVAVSSLYDAEENWHAYELEILQGRKK